MYINLDIINKVHRGMKYKKIHTLELPQVNTKCCDALKTLSSGIPILSILLHVKRETTIREDDELFMLPSI